MAWDSQLELIPGTNRNLELSAWFTPPELAARVVEWAGVRIEGCLCACHGEGTTDHCMSCERFAPDGPLRVLEPSAGNGALVRPLVAAGAEVHAVEIDGRYGDELRELVQPHGAARIGDSFLEFNPYDLPTFDLCVQNPPYENGLDVAFILHALKFAPRVVGIFQAGIEYGVDRAGDLWSVVRPTRMMKLKRRWFKSAEGKGGQTNYVVLELVKRGVLDKASTRPDQVTIEWW